MAKLLILFVFTLIVGENIVENNYCYWKNFDLDNPISAVCIPNEHIKVYDYYGLKNTTRTGALCCKWLTCRQNGDSEDSFNDHNYCRNIFQKGKKEADEEGPWCYRSDTKVKELCFNVCSSSDYICVSTTTPKYISTTTEDTTDEPDELPVIDIPTEHEKRRHSKVGRYVEPLTTFGFWTIIGTVIILLVMCALFPFIRIYCARRGMDKESKKDAEHREDVESYRILSKIFRENGRTPPSFEVFINIRNKCGKACDPKYVMED